MKKIRYISLMIAILILFSACNRNVPPDSISASSTSAEINENIAYLLTDFQLVRSDMSSSKITNAIVALNNTIEEYNGSKLKIKTDFKATDEADYEVLIGDVKRAEAQEIIATFVKGDYTIQTVKTAAGAKIIIAGFDDDMTLHAIEEFEKLLKDNSVLNNGNISTLDLKVNFYEVYKNFNIELGELRVVAQSAESNASIPWGVYQYPNLCYTKSGSIMANWDMCTDSFTQPIPMEGPSKAVSDDGGVTWRDATSSDIKAYGVRMSNGKYFAGFVGKGLYEVDYLNKYTPALTGVTGIKLYYASDIKEVDYSVLRASEYDANTGETTTFDIKVYWPYMPQMVHYDKFIHPVDRIFSVNCVNDLVAVGDDLYYCTYAIGFDSKTGTCNKFSGYYSTYVFKSTDCGRTWDYISQVSVTKDTFSTAEKFEGFNEPMMELMPDGSFVMLLRTGDNLPCYFVRSTDNCQTWSDPVKFADVGVRPQIMTLGCGVTLSVFGRDGLFIRGTSDPSGLVWEAPLEIELSASPPTERQSCYYTKMLALSPTEVLLIYTDFHYPLQNTDKPRLFPRKTILVRTVTIVPQEAETEVTPTSVLCQNVSGVLSAFKSSDSKKRTKKI